MDKRLAVLLTLTFLATVPSTSGAKAVEPFRLPGTDGHVVEVRRQGDARLTVVCFLGTECPLAKLYGPRLAELSRTFAWRVRFVGINSNQQDSMDEVRAYANVHRISFPMAKDYGNVVADQLDAQRTPEVFVLDRDLIIRYRGRIDDQYLPGMARRKPSRSDLRIAIEELLAGEPVTERATEPTGCFIGRLRQPNNASDVTFCNQIARVFHSHCVECHRPNEIGPFSLTEYEEAVGWADTILEVVEEGRMPPWHASPDHGQFMNARHMPAADKELLRDWVAAGMPYGDPTDLPPLPSFVQGWLLAREPDLVVSMRDEPFLVPAHGTLEYQYFVVDPEFEEDQWVTGAQIIPGNRRVVHHSIVFIRPPDGSAFRGVGWLAAYVPGQRSAGFPLGHAIKVPANSKLVFQQHYTPTGREQTDVTKIGILLGSEEEISHEVYSLVGIEQEFEIPPHEANYQVPCRVDQLPDQGQLLAIFPHMHLRGKAFRLFAKKDGESRILLDVPQYDFNWQHSYILTDPLPLSSLDALEFTATFDNSDQNPVNPDPRQHVTWGDQTWEEMAVAFFEVSEPRRKEFRPAVTGPAPTSSPEASRRIDEVVQHFLQRFDKNRDGEVDRFETPRVVRRFGFRDYDQDGDGKLTRAEIRKVARGRRP